MDYKNDSEYELLSDIDLAMWQLETPEDFQVISSLMVIDTTSSIAELSTIINTRLSAFSRFKQKIIDSPQGPAWIFDDKFDIRAHLHHIALPQPGNHETLQYLVSDLISSPLDYSRPLWQLHLIENYEGKIVLLARIHHCIGDGIALMRVLLSLTNDEKGTTTLPLPKPKRSPTVTPKEIEKSKNPLSNIAAWLHKGETLYQEGKNLLSHPIDLWDAAKSGIEAFTDIGKIMLEPTHKELLYKKGEKGTRRKAVWSQALDLSIIKRFGKYHQATINDVVVAMTNEAIRKHLLHHEQDISLDFPIIMPVNIRPKGTKTTLGNKIGMIVLHLPLDSHDIEETIKMIRDYTTHFKKSPEPFLIYNFMRMGGWTPKSFEHNVVDFITSKIMAIITNVPGPKKEVFLGKSKVYSMMFWVPQATQLGLGISIMSYNNQLFVGVTTNEKQVKDPEIIVQGFVEAYEKIVFKLDLLENTEVDKNRQVHRY